MLARRFMIVCLLMTLFGMLLSIVVAETSRKARSWEIGMIVPCVMEQGLVCAPPARN
jgi:hypothetical protein